MATFMMGMIIKIMMIYKCFVKYSQLQKSGHSFSVAITIILL